jgi:hypothetical protein
VTLRDLGTLGYVRGILDKLDELEQTLPDLTQVVQDLRRPVQQFQLGEFLRLLEHIEGQHERTKN